MHARYASGPGRRGTGERSRAEDTWESDPSSPRQMLITGSLPAGSGNPPAASGPLPKERLP